MYIPRKILKNSITQSIAASSTETIIITPTTWRVKTISITTGANSTVQDIRIDGVSIGTAESNNIETDFGEAIAQKSIEVDIQNTNTAAEDSTVDVKGIKLKV